MNQDKQTFLDKKLRPLSRWIFISRWLQAPLYLGLIVAQGFIARPSLNWGYGLFI
jgi:uncharacterized membrane protein YqhA